MTRPDCSSSCVAVVIVKGCAGADEPLQLQHGGGSEIMVGAGQMGLPVLKLFSRSRTSGGLLGCPIISNIEIPEDLGIQSQRYAQ